MKKNPKRIRYYSELQNYLKCSIKVTISGLKQFLVTESLFKLIKNAFYFTLKAFFRPEVCNFIKKETLAQVFPCESCDISKTTFFIEHLWWLLLKIVKEKHSSKYPSVLPQFICYPFFCKNIQLEKGHLMFSNLMILSQKMFLKW